MPGTMDMLVLMLMLTSGHFVLQPISGEVKTTIPVMLQGNALVTCPLSPRPSPSALLWRGPGSSIIATRGVVQSRFADGGKYRLIPGTGGPGAEPSLIVKRVDLGDEGVYCCGDVDSGHLLHCDNITVLVPVQSITIMGPHDVINEGSEVKVTCRTEGSKPAPDIRWLKTDSNGVTTQLHGKTSDRVQGNGTVDRQSTLTLTVDRSDHGATYRCQASVSVFTVQHTWSPDVYVSPMEPWLQTNSTKYRAGDVAYFRCVTSGSRPAAGVTWFVDRQAVRGSGEVMHRDRREEDGTFSTISTLTLKVSRHMNAAHVICSVTNVVLTSQKKPPRTADLKLRVEYAPVVTLNLSRGEVREGEEVQMMCEVSAQPPVSARDLHLALNDRLLPPHRAPSTAGHHFQLSNVTRQDRGRYHCIARNSVGTGVSLPVTFTVLFAPACVYSDVKYVYANLRQTVAIPCQIEGVPHDVTVTWVRRSTNETLHTSTAVTWTANDVAESVLHLKVISYEDVLCVASNSIGPTSTPCLLRLIPPQPPKAPHHCLSLRLPNGSRQLRCIPGHDGGSPVTFQLRVQGRHMEEVEVMTSVAPEPRFWLDGLDSGREWNLTVCAVATSFPRSPVCAPSLMLQADINARSSTGSSAGLIVGVVFGCTALITLLILLILSLVWHRRKMKRKPQLYDEGLQGAAEEEQSASLSNTPPEDCGPHHHHPPSPPACDRDCGPHHHPPPSPASDRHTTSLSSFTASAPGAEFPSVHTKRTTPTTDRPAVLKNPSGKAAEGSEGQTVTPVGEGSERRERGGHDVRAVRHSGRSSGSLSLPDGIGLHPHSRVYTRGGSKGQERRHHQDRDSLGGKGQRQHGGAPYCESERGRNGSSMTTQSVRHNSHSPRYGTQIPMKTLLPGRRETRRSCGNGLLPEDWTVKGKDVPPPALKDKRSSQHTSCSTVPPETDWKSGQRFSDPGSEFFSQRSPQSSGGSSWQLEEEGRQESPAVATLPSPSPLDTGHPKSSRRPSSASLTPQPGLTSTSAGFCGSAEGRGGDYDDYDVPRSSRDWRRAMSLLSLSAAGSGVLTSHTEGYVNVSKGRRADSAPHLDTLTASSADRHCQDRAKGNSNSNSNYLCVPSNKHAYINLLYQRRSQKRRREDSQLAEDTAQEDSRGAVDGVNGHWAGRRGRYVKHDGQHKRGSWSEQTRHTLLSSAASPVDVDPCTSPQAVTSSDHPSTSFMTLTPAPEVMLQRGHQHRSDSCRSQRKRSVTRSPQTVWTAGEDGAGRLGDRLGDRVGDRLHCADRDNTQHVSSEPVSLQTLRIKPDTPHAYKDTPHAYKDTPHADNDTPHADNDTPHAYKDTPHADTDTPHADNDTPHADTDTPHADADTPHADQPQLKEEDIPGQRRIPRLPSVRRNPSYFRAVTTGEATDNAQSEGRSL